MRSIVLTSAGWILVIALTVWGTEIDFKAISNEFYVLAVAVVIISGAGVIAFHFLFDKQNSFAETVKSLTETISTNQSELKEDVRKIRRELDTIQASPVFRESVFGHSPLQISELGMKISDQINAKTIARAYESEVEVDIQASDYARQKACMVYATEKLFENLDKGNKALIEQAAYDEGLEIEQVLRVIGIHLRDLIFARQNASRS